MRVLFTLTVDIPDGRRMSEKKGIKPERTVRGNVNFLVAPNAAPNMTDVTLQVTLHRVTSWELLRVGRTVMSKV